MRNFIICVWLMLLGWLRQVWWGNGAHGERSEICRIFWLGKWRVRPFGWLKCRWDDNIKIDLGEGGLNGLDYISFVLCRELCWDLVDIVDESVEFLVYLSSDLYLLRKESAPRSWGCYTACFSYISKLTMLP